MLFLQVHQRWIDVNWAEHSDDVLKSANESLLYLTQMSSQIRGYVIDKDREGLGGYHLADDRASASLAILASLVSDNPPQLERVGAISQLKEELSARYGEVIQNSATANCANCKDILAAARPVIASLNDEFSQFLQVENRLKAMRQERQSASARNTVLVIVLLLLVVLAAAAYSVWNAVRRVAAIYDKALAATKASRAQAEMANHAKDEFLGIVSHELRGPLSAMSMWTQVLLKGGNDDQKLRRGLEAISRAIQSETQMIDDLLDVARIGSGKLRIDVRTADLPAIIEAAIDAVRPSADAKDIHLHVLLDPKAGPVAGDPERLQQVFWNLLSNAVKFTPKGGRIEVKLERINSHVEIAVSDNGQGIDPSAARRIFDPFWQAEGGPSRSHTGLGLGLSIVKRIVEMHGGSIVASSEGLGHGATFTVILPVSLARRVTFAGAEHREHPTIADSAADGAVRLDGIRVLAVDDQADAAAAIRALLLSRGADVRTAESVREAFAVLEEWRPAIIVSDIGMPNEDGYFLIRKLRERPANQGGETPAIALTAYGRVQDTVRLLEAGFQMHVTKPVEPAELFAAIWSVSKTSSELAK
jgi:signal transduction histidine kinase/ActR/RegA family two-component response regulator